MLVNPRLGRRRCRGIWPPSKPRIRRDPLRERCPLLPRVEVLPMPEPMPRPTRLRLAEAFFGARNVERFIIVSRFPFPATGSKPRLAGLLLFFHDLDQVWLFGCHAPERGCVLALDHLVQASETQALDDRLVFLGSGNGRTHPLEADGGAALSSCRHGHSSSAALPRMAATSLRSRSFFKASNVARTTLCGLVVPMDLVITFCTPAEVMTARTAPPAMTPVPSGAGFSSTMPEPKRPSTAWGMVGDTW